jgi:hypothetical protein
VDQNANYNDVGAGYFAALGMPLLAGREFATLDDANGPKVALVNQAFARKFNLDERETVGKRMRLGRGEDLDIEIIGLVKDAKYNSAGRGARAVLPSPPTEPEPRSAHVLRVDVGPDVVGTSAR